MDVIEGPELDTTELRAHYGSAIDAYESAASELNRNRVVVRATQFGSGFGDQGVRIAQALEDLHAATLGFLGARTQNWQRIVELSREVGRTDMESSSGFGEVTGL